MIEITNINELPKIRNGAIQELFVTVVLIMFLVEEDDPDDGNDGDDDDTLLVNLRGILDSRICVFISVLNPISLSDEADDVDALGVDSISFELSSFEVSWFTVEII